MPADVAEGEVPERHSVRYLLDPRVVAGTRWITGAAPGYSATTLTGIVPVEPEWKVMKWTALTPVGIPTDSSGWVITGIPTAALMGAFGTFGIQQFTAGLASTIVVLSSAIVMMQAEPEYRTVRVGSASHRTSIARFPLFQGALPMGRRWATDP